MSTVIPWNGFWRAVGIGLLLSALGAVLYAVLPVLLGARATLHLVLLLVGTLYLLDLLRQGDGRTGMVLALAGWALLAAALLLLDPRLSLWLALPLVYLWLVRCLRRYDSLLGAAVDGAISALALLAAVAAAGHTRSLFLALWCFFLVMALHTLVAPRRHAAAPAAAGNGLDGSFEAAQQVAEAALRRLSSRHS